MTARKLFPPEALEAVVSATREVESRTAGEIVTYIAPRCDAHGEPGWMAATLGALLAALGFGTAHWLGEMWGGSGLIWITLPTVVGAALGFVLGSWWPPLTRLLLPEGVLDGRVARRATQAFVEEEVFATSHRTGILIFVALFERRVLVMADSGIEARVPEGAWQEIVEPLADKLRRGQVAEGLVEAVRECGKILEEHGVEDIATDENVLEDEVRFGDDPE